MSGPHLDAPRRVAVVGSGVAGLTAAYVASRTAHVTLYEADDRLGGHADTHRVTETRSDGSTHELGIDTGFIVHNRRTYPTLLRLFAELGVPTQQSEMSMSIRDDDSDLEWAGALGRQGVLPTRGHLTRPAYLRMLTEIPRFHRQAKAVLASGTESEGATTARCGSSWPRRLQRLLRAPLHGADGRRGLVLRPGGLPGVPRPLPLQLPRAPRHAQHLRLADLAHRDRRLAHLRAARRRRAAGGPPRHQGDLGPRDARWRRGDRRQRRGRVVRRRGARDAPLAGPGAAGRADPAAPRAARRDALLAQHRAAAHRHLGAAAAGEHLGVVELPAPQRRAGAPRRGRAVWSSPTT